MSKNEIFKRFLPLIVLFLLSLIHLTLNQSALVFAQNPSSNQSQEPAQDQTQQATTEPLDFTREKLAPILTTSLRERLEELQKVINEKTQKLNKLKKDFTKQGDQPELDKAIQYTQRELEIAQNSFEEIVIGEVSLNVFKEDNGLLTWQEELALVIKPLLENLRGLTEKPRQKENLKAIIREQNDLVVSAQVAIDAINVADQDKHSAAVNQGLKKIKSKWQELENDAQRKKELAEIELAKLNGRDESLFAKLIVALKEFAQERGLTIAIAIVVIVLITWFFKTFTKLLEYRRKKNIRKNSRTVYRVLIYAQRLVMIVTILIGVLMVFFLRGDVLLMALMLIVIFTAAMGLKSFLPQFIEESRLLLNVGRVREQELVNYGGIPWRVASINLFSLLINPEIRGVLRLPLSDLKQLKSRQIKEEKWFPSSIGDWVLDENNQLYEVINQTPDAVELQSSQGTNKLVPSADYYSAGLVNLTKSPRIRITGVFGVDYSLQSISLSEVPEKLQKGLDAYLKALDLGTDDISCRVEFQTANSSSLDYIIIVLVNSIAACHYYLIERAIQQACVKVCNDQNWTIPFPQLTLNREVKESKDE